MKVCLVEKVLFVLGCYGKNALLHGKMESLCGKSPCCEWRGLRGRINYFYTAR